MDIASLIGFLGAIGMILGAMISGGGIAPFIDVPSILIVFGGTFFAVMYTCPLPVFLGSFGVMAKAFLPPVKKMDELVERMSDLASIARKDGMMALEGQDVPDKFFQKGLQMLVDGADEANDQLQLIKGGGAALTREKIVAAVAERFICIADESKRIATLGAFPLPVEVIPMARSHVARELVKLGGQPVWREGTITDNGNVILDVHGLHIASPIELERQINDMTGVVCNGLFALRPADELLLGTPEGVLRLTA